MVTRYRSFFAFVVFLTALAGALAQDVSEGQLAPSDWGVKAVAVDSSGTVWATTLYRRGVLLQWTSNGWRVHLQKLAPDMDGCGIVEGPDGAIYCAWDGGEGKPIIVTRQFGGISRVFARITPGLFYCSNNGSTSCYENVTMFFDKRGDLWVLHDGRFISAVDSHGRNIVGLVAPDSHFTAGKDYEETQPSYATLRGLSITGDSVLIYSDGIQSYGKWLRGVYLWNGKALVYKSGLPGVPWSRFTVCALRDKKTLWLGVANVGMYSVDVGTLQGRRLGVPDEKAFEWVDEIQSIGSDVYVCVWAYHSSGKYDDLWRLRAGRWTRLISGLDKDNDGCELPERPIFQSSHGLWAASSSGGLWYIPNTVQKATQVDWRRGLRVQSPEFLASFPNDKLLITGDRSQVIGDEIPPEIPAASNIVAVHPSQYPLLVDSRKHVWGSEIDSVDDLYDWCGMTTTRYFEPKRLNDASTDHVTLDTQGQVWYLPELPNLGLTAVFNPNTAKFTLYDTYQQAITSTMKTDHPLTLIGNEPTQPKFDSAGRALFGANNSIYYFDGARWKTWTAKQIGNVADDSFGTAYFSEDGAPSVFANGKVFRFSSGRWKSTPADADPTAIAVAAENQPPSDSPAAAGESRQFDDSTQTWWFTKAGKLYRQAYGICKPVFAAGATQPFIDGRRLIMVAVDASGRTWLDTSWGDSHDFVVIAAPTPRRVTIDGRLVNSDCYTFRFASPIVQHLKFRWRLDDGKWSEPSGSGPFALDSLPNGAHTVSVQSIDDLAIVDPVLTNETFTVNVNTAKQISGLIQRLIIGTTTDRNSAVEALARQPAAALPSLNAGLANSTDETTTWWITAAIQACERADKPL